MNGYGYAFQTTKCLHRVLLCIVCCSVVALRIELSAIRLSDAGFFLLANAGTPALDYHFFSRVCRNRTALDRPKRPVPAITLHARFLSSGARLQTSVDCLKPDA